MIQKAMNWVLGREAEKEEIPLCPDHKVPMRLRGTQGYPAKFRGQSEETYTLIYFCGEPQCNQTALVKRVRSQGSAPAEYTDRPVYARQDDQTS